MERLLAKIRRGRLQFHKSGKWFLLRNNVSAHSSILVKQYVTKRKVISVGRPPYSPDLASLNYFLVSKLKISTEGHCFSSVEEIPTKVTNERPHPECRFGTHSMI